MKGIIIYKSVHHGNTLKVAEKMAEVLNAEIKEVEEANAEEIKNYDIIGFGSGIYFGRHHRRILKFVDELPSMYGKKAFIFSTRGGTPTYLNHMALRRKLKSRGFIIVGEFSCRGYDTYSIFKYIGGVNKGKPDEKDLERAADFARKIEHLK